MESPDSTEREKRINSARKKKLSFLRTRNDKSVKDLRDNLEKEVGNFLARCQDQRKEQEKIARMRRLSTARQQKRQYLHLQEKLNNITPDKRIRLEEEEDAKLCDALEEAEKMYRLAEMSTSSTNLEESENETAKDVLRLQQRKVLREQSINNLNNRPSLIGDQTVKLNSRENRGSIQNVRSNVEQVDDEDENGVDDLPTPGQLSYLENLIRQQEHRTYREDSLTMMLKMQQDLIPTLSASDSNTNLHQMDNPIKRRGNTDMKCSPSIRKDNGLAAGRQQRSSVEKSPESRTNMQQGNENPQVSSNARSSLFERLKQSATAIIPDLVRKVKQESPRFACKMTPQVSENQNFGAIFRETVKQEPSDTADRHSPSVVDDQSNGVNQNPRDKVKQEVTTIKTTTTEQNMSDERKHSNPSARKALNIKNAQSNGPTTIQTGNMPVEDTVRNENNAGDAVKYPNPIWVKISGFRGGELPDWLVRSPPRPLSIRQQKMPLPAGRTYSWIFFDMQTDGFGGKMEIIHLEATTGDKSFSRYVMPKFTSSMNLSTSMETHLSIKGDKLMKGEKVLDAISIDECLKEFSDWLKQFPNPVLVLFNAYEFDANNLCRCIAYTTDGDDASIAHIVKPRGNPLGYASVCTLVSSQIVGFSDIINMYETKFPGKKGPPRIQYLINEVTNRETEFDAHNALTNASNAEALHMLCSRLNFTDKELRKASFTFEHAFRNMQISELLDLYKRSLYHMDFKEKCLSGGMVKKFAENGVSFQHLLNAFRRGGILAVDFLLGGYEEGTVKITRNKRIIKTVCEYMQSYIDGLVDCVY